MVLCQSNFLLLPCDTSTPLRALQLLYLSAVSRPKELPSGALVVLVEQKKPNSPPVLFLHPSPYNSFSAFIASCTFSSG